MVPAASILGDLGSQTPRVFRHWIRGQSGCESQLTSTARADHYTSLNLHFPVCTIGVLILARAVVGNQQK